MGVPGYLLDMLPAAPDTIEVRYLLPTAQDGASERQTVTLPEPCTIVGISTGVQPLGAVDNEVAPTRDSVLVAIDSNKKRIITESSEESSDSTGVDDGAQAVSLACLDSQAARRLLCWRVGNAKPELGLRFFWALDPSVLQFQRALVRVSFFVLYDSVLVKSGQALRGALSAVGD